MLEIIVASGSAVFYNLVQLLIGCVLSIPLYFFTRGRLKSENNSFLKSSVAAVMFSFAGTLIPLGTYGLLPITAVLLKLGFRSYTVFPLVVSNAVFNMLVPYNDPSFTWKNGYQYIILAVVMGVFSRFILSLPNTKGECLFRQQSLSFEKENSNVFQSIAYLAGKNINTAGSYLVTGVCLDILFNKYILSGIINEVFTNPYTSSIPLFFSRYDVTGPAFLMFLTLTSVLTDLTKLSALVVMLKPTGLVVYFSCCLAWGILLAVPAFI